MLSMVYAMSLALSEPQTLITLDTSEILKNRTTNVPVSLFVSPPLLTDQGNIATGEQSVIISVKPSSDIAINYNGIDIQPGHFGSFQITVDNQGRLSLPLSPARSGEVGKSDFELSVANIKSIHDRFWESATPTYTAWVDSGKDVDVGNWLPMVERQMKGFIQTQAYSDVHQRNKQQRRHDTNTGIYENVGSPILESKKVPNTRTRSVSATAGTWVDNGAAHTCTAWSPNTSTQYQTVNFQQKRDCKQPQKRKWRYLSSGEEVGQHDEKQVIDVTQSRTVEGSKTPWKSATDSFTPWENIGSRFGYTGWTPTASLQTANFVQSRDYSYKQERTRQKREINALTNELRNTGSAATETQTLKAKEQRAVQVSSGNWSTPTTQDCSEWTPYTNTVALNREFTQTRNCNKTKTRTWTYKTGGSTLHTRIETNSYSQQESKKSTGTKANWVPYASSFTEWENSTGPMRAQWTPSVKSQVSDFTQTLTIKQPQIRTEQKREKENNTGQLRDVGTPIQHTRTQSTTHSRTVTVASGNWSTPITHDCSAWTPSASTIALNKEFTQTRSCNKSKTRPWTYKTGGSTLHTRVETNSYSQQESKKATGSKAIWEPYPSTFTEWKNKYGPMRPVWKPSIGTQESDFTQTSTTKQPQIRTEQKREIEKNTGQIRDVGSPIQHSRTLETTRSRDVTVTSSPWIIKNGKEERTFKYESNGMELKRRTEYREIAHNWVPAKSVISDHIYDFDYVYYTDFLPAPERQRSDYEQGRMEETPYTYYVQKRERDQVTGTYRNVGEPIEQTGTHRIVGEPMERTGLRNGVIYRTVKVEGIVSYSNWSRWEEVESRRSGWDCELIIDERKRTKTTLYKHIADSKVIHSFTISEEEVETDSNERCWD